VCMAVAKSVFVREKAAEPKRAELATR
jgi:hypothetical protein